MEMWCIRSTEGNFPCTGLLESAVFYPVFIQQQKAEWRQDTSDLNFRAIRERKPRWGDCRMLITFWRAEEGYIF
jgi:hypothetical protein